VAPPEAFPSEDEPKKPERDGREKDQHRRRPRVSSICNLQFTIFNLQFSFRSRRELQIAKWKLQIGESATD
jgi:hypothetical protein